MPYYIYVKNDIGAYELLATADSYEEIITKYTELVQYKRIQDILLTENIPYTVTYDSTTKQYTADYSN
jgi:hypothetical protein